VVDGVEEALDVEVDHPASPDPHQPTPQRLQRLVRVSPRPEAVRAVQEVLLVDRLQKHQDRPLEDLVLQRRHPDRPGRARTVFGDVDAAHSRRAVATGLESLEQARQILLQPLRVLRGGDPIHTRRAGLARLPPRLAQPLHVDMVGQRRQHQLRLFRGQCRDLLSFR